MTPNLRRVAGSLPSAIATIAVVTVLLFVGSTGRFRFKYVEWWGSTYANLAEGFLHGQVSLFQTPDPALVALPDPYQPSARDNVKSVHDATYFRGKFYLYFTPLPVLLVYIPVKLMAGRYPSEPLVGTFFAICAFLVQAAFVMHALRDRRTWLPRWLWIAFAGVGNITLFLLVDVWMYEVAILSATFFSSLWAYSMLRFAERATWRTALMLGTFLALSIVSRPTLLILGLVTLGVLRTWRDAARVAIPLLVIGSLYGAYNYARFRSPFETGQQYQLTNVSLREFRSCGLCTRAELGRFFNSVQLYLFRAPAFDAHFPFVSLRYNEYDPEVTFPARHEEVGGVVPVIPLLVLSTFAAMLLLMAKAREPASRVAMLLTAGGWLTMLGLSTCAWVTARYELDFLPLLVLGAVLAIEEGFTRIAALGLNILPMRVTAIVLAGYSIVIGTALGLTGRTQAFSRYNPELFARIAGWFTPP